MIRLIHPIAGAVAMLTIANFWISTVLVELFGGAGTVAALKTTIPWGFLLLVPALAAAGASGLTLAAGQKNGVVGSKLRRMPIIAANGLLVLIPSALFLASKARAAEFDRSFYVVQALELVAGFVNLTLLALSMRDGFRLTQWRRHGLPRPLPKNVVTLLERIEPAPGTVALTFDRPAGLVFSAGQAVYLTLPALNGCDARGRTRTFSIASAPHERGLLIATRLSDTSFKRAFAALTIGSQVVIEGPCGGLTLHADAGRPAVFLAGGIGITPFRSIVIDATKRVLPQRLFLFYSHRLISDAAFLDDLVVAAQRNPQLTVIPIVTSAEVPTGWTGESGAITIDMIQRHVGGLSEPIYYLAGPPSMVTAIQVLLKGVGVAEQDVRLEAFSGY